MVDDVTKPSSWVNPWKVFSPNVDFSDRNLKAGPMLSRSLFLVSIFAQSLIPDLWDAASPISCVTALAVSICEEQEALANGEQR